MVRKGSRVQFPVSALDIFQIKRKYCMMHAFYSPFHFFIYFMAKAKSTLLDWFCIECNSENYHSGYNKRDPEGIKKEKPKYCSKCRSHKTHKAKDA